MRPVDSFLESVRDAFRPSDDTPGWVWLVVLFCLVSIFAGALVRSRRRTQEEDEAFARFLASRKIPQRQVQLLDRLAARAKVTPKMVATQIDAFERATALELADHPPPLPTAGDEGIFGEVAALRRALGFERIAGHVAVLTTRELGTGQIVKVAGGEATVTEVTEAFFAVAAPATATIPVGAIGSRVRVTLVHGQEARYETRCVLLAKQAGAETQKLVFSHDEQPTRIQMRKAVRVTVRGPVELHPIHPAAAVAVGASKAPAAATKAASPTTKNASEKEKDNEEANQNQSDSEEPGENQQPNLGNGSLIDISVGGAALDSNLHIAVGSLVHLSFELDGVAYRDLSAFVLESAPRARGTHHMRLQFRNLAQSDENQLAATVARYSAKPFAQQPT